MLDASLASCTVSRTSSGKWLLYSHGKLIKPYDYVPSDYSTLLIKEAQDRRGSESGPSGKGRRNRYILRAMARLSTPLPTLGQVTMCDNLPKRATDQTGQHGWQSALMTSMMWLSNVVGEYLTELDQKPEVAPVHLPRLMDDPVSTLEQTVMDLQVAQSRTGE